MTPQEFANKIRQKYPDGVTSDGRKYAEIEDSELTNRIVEKYPVYKSQISEPGTIARMKEKLTGKERTERVKSIVSPYVEGKQGLGATGFQLGGEVLRGAAEAGAELPVIKQGIELFGQFVKGLSEQEPIKQFGEDIGEKIQPAVAWYDSLEPEKKRNVDAAIEYLSAIPAGKGTKVALKSTEEAIEAGVRTTTSAVRTGVEATKELATKGKELITEAPGVIAAKTKAAVTGVPLKTGEAKVFDDALEIGREKVTPAYETTAASQGRTFTEGRTKQVKFKPTRREELISDALEPLVREGRISADKLPFENVPEVLNEVSRINFGVRDFIATRKAPFNKNQLRSKIDAVADENKLVFASDETAQNVFTAVKDEFMSHVDKMDTLGLFDARQSFDQLPAIQKLLKSEKLGENVKRQIVLDIRRAANEYISELLPVNSPYRDLLKQESYLLEAVENMAEKSRGLKNSTNITRFLDANPLIKKLLPATLVGTGLAI